ncbi:hypothetical protein MLD38_037491 [Melastoma candidum]|uniref:Uncharacterized protein n=1 Tax=Melastoma candidum TaxID=119954 RepID=A0ACB9LMV4_9MYRT|nr:hypothetical protein MLD38_037491 [Melastoma candidum]
MRGVVRHVSTRYPKANIHAVGWSLGANILVRYLGELAFYLYVIEATFRKVELNLVQGFAMFERHLLLLEDMGGEYNIPLAVNVKTVKDFDEGLTLSFGFKSADDYYFHSNSSDSIRNVCTPLLCIQVCYLDS